MVDIGESFSELEEAQGRKAVRISKAAGTEIREEEVKRQALSARLMLDEAEATVSSLEENLQKLYPEDLVDWEETEDT